MEDLDESYDSISLQRIEIDGSFIYKDHNNNLFNDKGMRISSTKFETWLEGESKQQKEVKETKEAKEAKEAKDKSKKGRPKIVASN